MGLMGGTLNPEDVGDAGLRVLASMAMPTKVFTSETASAPAFSGLGHGGNVDFVDKFHNEAGYAANSFAASFSNVIMPTPSSPDRIKGGNIRLNYSPRSLKQSFH